MSEKTHEKVILVGGSRHGQGVEIAPDLDEVRFPRRLTIDDFGYFSGGPAVYVNTTHPVERYVRVVPHPLAAHLVRTYFAIEGSDPEREILRYLGAI